MTTPPALTLVLTFMLSPPLDKELSRKIPEQNFKSKKPPGIIHFLTIHPPCGIISANIQAYASL
jgi:hypothetical protein